MYKRSICTPWANFTISGTNGRFDYPSRELSDFNTNESVTWGTSCLWREERAVEWASSAVHDQDCTLLG
jgi:hypothetical protein